MKRLFFTTSLFSLIASFNSYAFTDKEWVNFIVDSIETKDDLSWKYDVDKLKTYSKMTKDEDIKILIDIANGDDYQVSQASKYLLALEGQKTNEFILDNYFEDNDVKNGLYYTNLNFINTPEKKHFWSLLKDRESLSINIVKDEFENCKDFNDIKELGGVPFTFENYDDFFEKRSLIEDHTHADLMYMEMDLMDQEYPVSVTVFQNRYVINKENEDNCTKPNESLDYNYLQKIMALYKQYQKESELNLNCKEFDDNKLLKSKFYYLCN